jgi:CheY-like chemotaxis protein
VRLSVLLVEDSPDVLATIGRFLEAAGFDVMRADNGDAALSALVAGPRFALLVTDYAMPGLNGRDLAIRARAMFPDLKVLIITGFPNAEALRELPAGVAVMVKPFRRAKLIAQLSEWFDIGQPISPTRGD